MEITPFFDPQKEHRTMNIAAFMSGSGTNVVEILKHEEMLKEKESAFVYKVVAVFTDNSGSNARKIAKDWEKYGIEYLFWKNIDEFYRERGYQDKRAKGASKEEKLRLRTIYDSETRLLLDRFSEQTRQPIDAIALGGHMSFLTAPILDYACNVNVHPADLRIIYKDPETGKTKRKYTGDNAVRDAIAAGEPTIRSSVHIATAEVDYGPLLMISEPLKVEIYSGDGKVNPDRLTVEQLVEHAPEELQKVAKHNQDRLKEKGDWVIFPKTLEMMAKGMFGKDGDGKVYHKNNEGVWTPGEIVLG